MSFCIYNRSISSMFKRTIGVIIFVGDRLAPIMIAEIGDVRRFSLLN